MVHLFDNGEYQRVPVREVPQDPLKFRDSKRHSDRLKAMKAETDLDDAVLVGEGKLEGQEVVVAVQDFGFMGGSLGMAAGEALVSCNKPSASSCRRVSRRRSTC